jgi:hypothetical protein
VPATADFGKYTCLRAFPARDEFQFRGEDAETIFMKSLLGCCAGLAAFLLVGTAAYAEDAGPRLTIEARLFGSTTGKLSENVLAPDGPELGNVVMGENASTSTFVVVHIAAEPPLQAGAKIRLLAVETPGEGQPAPAPGGALLDSAVDVPATAAGNKDTYVGFWLADTGCTPIALKAELLVAEAPTASADATLDFTCHE